MTLLDVRKKLVELSGRYDLVVDYEGGDYTDNGANFFIQAGQRYLDRLLPFAFDQAEVSFPLAAGEYELTDITGFRAVKNVRLVGADGTQVYLTRMTKEDFRNEFGSETSFDALDQSTPAFYAVRNQRSSTPSTDDEVSKSLLILPPPDQAVTIYVEGLFESASLTADANYSFWSLAHPDVLLQAALYKMEQFYRNTAGANDYRAALLEMVSLLDQDVVEQEIAGVDSFRNSW